METEFADDVSLRRALQQSILTAAAEEAGRGAGQPDAPEEDRAGGSLWGWYL